MSKDPFARPKSSPLDEEKLGMLARLANMLNDRQQKVAALEKDLKNAKQDLTRLEEETIPAFMQELGVASIKLKDGKTVSITSQVYASISQANHDAAMEWLIKNGHEDLIKLTITGTFGKDEYELAVDVRNRLTKEGAKVSSDENVHPQTLRAFIREQLEQGVAIPLDVFGARTVTKATIK